MAHNTIPTAKVEANAVLDQTLFEDHLKNNDDDHETRILALEAGGGGGGGGPESSGDIGSIIAGGDTNEAIYWKRRFHPIESMLSSDNSNQSGFNPEGDSLKNELLQFIQSNDDGITIGTDATNYLGQYLIINKDSSISFKIKKGINFFSIGSFFSVGCDNMEVRIDGATPSSLGLVDENGNAAPDFYSENSGTNFSQVTTFFYGLDGEEHVINLKNNDSGSNISRTNFIEVGYRSENPTIDETIKINAGKASVRGTEVSFNESELSFSKTDLNGHTGAIICDKTGTLSLLDGESPAMTQAKPEESIAFSSAVTNLKVKNNFYFPDNGICLLSTPHGNHHLFSYTDKIDASIQSHQFDNLIWSSQPTEDFIPCNNFNSGTVGAATGDLNINYWGTAPILIDATNNKLDFTITIGGVKTTHVATIVSGRYAADLVPLEVALRSAMQTVKPLNGEYHLKYNSTSRLWSFYVDDTEVEEVELLFSTGANSGTSIHGTLGFSDNDLTGNNSYIATGEVEHLCCRALERDSTYMHVEDPRIKYAEAPISKTGQPSLLDLEDRLGLTLRFMGGGSGNTNFFQIYVDKDCSGLEINFASFYRSSTISFQVDDGQMLYLLQTDESVFNTTTARGKLQTAFISFPRGSRKITVREETSGQFKISSNTVEHLVFAGCRQYFTKPAYEKLTTSQAVIKTFEVSPISLYATIYGNNGGAIYSPNASDDNINTITESGSWTGAVFTSGFNASRRFTNTQNDYVDYNFTLVGDGGGFFVKQIIDTNNSKTAIFISQAAINESTDRVLNVWTLWGTQYYDTNPAMLLGLPAGTYNVRIKMDSTGQMENSGFGVIDTVSPQENANNVNDINNAGQGISYPINVIREKALNDSSDLVPQWLERSGYKEGKVTNINYRFNSPLFQYLDESASFVLFADGYYSTLVKENVLNAEVSFSGFVKSISLRYTTDASYNNNMQAFIDGVQTLNIHSLRNQVKGGSAPSATREATSNFTQKEFKLSCTHSAGLVFNIADTRGLKNNQVIILDDGTNKEKAVIASFVVGTSFTIKKALTVVVAASVTGVEYQGFHSYKTVLGSALVTPYDAFEYEPLKVSKSNAINRRSATFEYEKVSVIHRGVSNGDDLYYPAHSDGVVGNWSTSSIEVIGKSAASFFNFPQDLRNISISSGTLDLKITSERLVPVLSEKERF